jgi:hypothetical protein
MELLISFLLALGLITNSQSANLSSNEVKQIAASNHDLLVKTYGDQYLKIITTNENEKD